MVWTVSELISIYKQWGFIIKQIWQKYWAKISIASPRCFFLLMFLLVVSLTGIFISQTYTTWKTSTIVTMSSDTTHISEMPFPGTIWSNRQCFSTFSSPLSVLYFFLWEAVTICNMNLAKKSVVERMPNDSIEYSIVQDICMAREKRGGLSATQKGAWPQYQRVITEVCATRHLSLNHFYLI